MDFCFNDFYQLERKGERILRSVLKIVGSNSLSSLTEQDIRRAYQDGLSNIVLSLVDVAVSSMDVLRSAAVKMEKYKSDQILSQQAVIKLQEELIRKQSSSESVDSRLTSEQLKEELPSVVKSVVRENERQKQVVLFGVPEHCDLGRTIDDVLTSACGQLKPKAKDYSRVGTPKPGTIRPIKVSFKSQEEARITISSAKSLKQSKKYKDVFIAPDRSPEERVQRRKLVQKLREKRQQEPGRRHYISQGKVCSTSDHRQETSQLPTAVVNTRLNNFQTVFANQCKVMEERLNRSIGELSGQIDASFDRMSKVVDKLDI